MSFNIDALLLAEHDWANTGWRFNKCLRMKGVRSYMYKAYTHPFMYPEQAPIHQELLGVEDHKLMPLSSLMAMTKVIHFIGSTYIPGTEQILKHKKVVVQHGGTVYRQNAEEVNKYFNEYAHKAIIQCPDLLGLGANNEVLIYYPVDTDFIQPVYYMGGKKKIGHFPSNPVTKGTENILEVIKILENDPDYKDKFEYVGKRDNDKSLTLWEHNLDRIAHSDIIIETCNLEQNGKKYGEWGNTAIEAAASGKVVVTNTLSAEVYRKEYGECELVIANVKEALLLQLKQLIDMSDEQFRNKQYATREWVVKNHGMEATANRLWNTVYKDLM